MDFKFMFEYMIEVDLPIPFEEDFVALIPRQRAMVNGLMREGIVTSYALAIESGKLWITMLAESEQGVINLLEEFPIRRHIMYKINKLTFHNSIGHAIPQFSAN